MFLTSEDIQISTKASFLISTDPWMQNKRSEFHFFKWANPALFFIYFGLFKHTLQILQQIGM